MIKTFIIIGIWSIVLFLSYLAFTQTNQNEPDEEIRNTSSVKQTSPTLKETELKKISPNETTTTEDLEPQKTKPVDTSVVKNFSDNTPSNTEVSKELNTAIDTAQAEVDDARVRATISMLRGAAEIEYDADMFNPGYQTVCTNINIVNNLKKINGECKGGKEAYVFFSKLSNNSYYCADSDGYGDSISSPPVGTACKL